MSCSSLRNILHACTQTVLPFRLGENVQRATALQSYPQQEVLHHTKQALQAAIRTGRKHFILLGVGDGQLADSLAAQLPADITLTVIERTPENVRAAMASGRLRWYDLPGRHRLICDTSVQALAVLLWQSGLMPEDATMFIHPGLSKTDKEQLKEWQRFYTGGVLLKPTAPKQEPLTVAAILHPSEPHLEDFIAHIPIEDIDIQEIILVWDAPEVPHNAPDHPNLPVRHLARQLQNDFAAQRNTALAACTTEWVFMLDGDERLHVDSWRQLPILMSSHAGAFGFSRLTYIGSEAACRIGFGLWPDIQIRLFRKGEQTTFERPIHERLVHPQGPTAMCLTAPILHHSHLVKSTEELARKLTGFNQAEGAPQHRLNTEYPVIATSTLLSLLTRHPAGTSVLFK